MLERNAALLASNMFIRSTGLHNSRRPKWHHPVISIMAACLPAEFWPKFAQRMDLFKVKSAPPLLLVNCQKFQNRYRMRVASCWLHKKWDNMFGYINQLLTSKLERAEHRAQWVIWTQNWRVDGTQAIKKWIWSLKNMDIFNAQKCDNIIHCALALVRVICRRRDVTFHRWHAHNKMVL